MKRVAVRIVAKTFAAADVRTTVREKRELHQAINPRKRRQVLAQSRSTCANEVASQYLVDLVGPAPGTVFEQDFVPFAR
jgi:hypothetical protein